MPGILINTVFYSLCNNEVNVVHSLKSHRLCRNWWSMLRNSGTMSFQLYWILVNLRMHFFFFGNNKIPKFNWEMAYLFSPYATRFWRQLQWPPWVHSNSNLYGFLFSCRQIGIFNTLILILRPNPCFILFTFQSTFSLHVNFAVYSFVHL